MDAISRSLYDEIRRLARSRIRNDRAGRSICATDLAHEVLERGLRHGALAGIPRDEVLRRISRLSRQVLVDRARARGRLRRGAGEEVVQLALDPAAVPGVEPLDLLALDEALSRLGALDRRQAHMIELRYFGGCSVDEVARVLAVSRSTVEKEERKARAWLELVLAESP
jgi:RNA polymerase sigma factor (TIGR02999 family)